MQPAEAIRNYFAKLGLEPQIADIYLALHTNGPQNISELSRNSKVERTRIYRLIDKLLESNLIEVETHYKRGIIKAAPIANINILISQREQELKNLQEELGLIQQVLARNSLSSPATRVQFYNGPEGIRQMFWNQTHAKTELLCLLHENLQFHTPLRYVERWIEEMNRAQVAVRAVFDENFVENQTRWNKDHQNEPLKHWQGRQVSTDFFIVRHNMNIYDNVVATYSLHDGEVFGIETYNQDIADTQRQLFEMLWQSAQPKDVQNKANAQ